MADQGKHQSSSAKERLAKKRREVAHAVTELEPLIAALCYYIGRMEPGKWIRLGEPRIDKDKVVELKPYLVMARRILDIRYNRDNGLRLAQNYKTRLSCIGLGPLSWYQLDV